MITQYEAQIALKIGSIHGYAERLLIIKSMDDKERKQTYKNIAKLANEIKELLKTNVSERQSRHGVKQ